VPAGKHHVMAGRWRKPNNHLGSIYGGDESEVFRRKRDGTRAQGLDCERPRVPSFY
jgi:hypothetical protein